MVKWKIDDLLSVGEAVIYKTRIEDEACDTKTDVYLTNFRLIWISDDFLDCRLLKFISKYGIFIGYEEYSEEDDIGTGEYGIYFGDFEKYETLWFYSENVWHTFYSELSRILLEEI